VLGVMNDGVAAMPCLLSTVVAARNLVSAEARTGLTLRM
jgi:hypothetical protein